MPREGWGRTILVAFALCAICSLLVSVAAVSLRPAQQSNRQLFMKKNVLIAAGLFDPSKHTDRNVEELFGQVEAVVVNLATDRPTDEIDPSKYNQRKAINDPALSRSLKPEEDIATIKRREKYSLVYLVRGEDGSLEQIILPIRGYGLWSIMYGFISLDSDTTTIRGITFYEHGETPGLGGEIDNPEWKKKWSNPSRPKQVYNKEGEVAIRVIKGSVDPDDPMARFKVDGISAATFTSRGVSNMLRFWLGESGFGPYLKNLREKGGEDG